MGSDARSMCGRWVLAMTIAVPGLWVGIARPGGSVEASIDPGRRLCFVAGVGSPGDLAMVNLTPVNASAPGYGQLVSSDVQTPPTASNVNFGPGTVDPNVAFAQVGADGAVCFYNRESADVDLVADLVAVLNPDAYTLNPPDGAPTRIADTRVGLAGGRITRSERRCFASLATPGDLAVVNLTPVLASTAGYGALTSSDVTVAPTASNVNFRPGTVDPNVAITAVGADGQLCFHNSDHAEVHLVADLQTTLHADAAASTGTAVRIADTRVGLAGSRIAPGERRCFASHATPGDLAVVNLTPVLASAAGFGALTSSDVTVAPTASNVNFRPGTIDPNVATTRIGTDGQVCFHNSDDAEVDLVADLQTSLDAVAAAPSHPAAPYRLVDTRGEFRDTINCPTSTRCYAAGDQFYVSDDFGTTWQLSQYATPDLDHYPLRAITCLTTTICTFRGWPTGNPRWDWMLSVSYVTVDGGQTWRPPGLVRIASDIDCPTDDTCLAVGRFTEPPSTDYRTAAVTTDGGRIWRNIELPPPSDGRELAGVHCVSSSKCSAISQYWWQAATTLLTFTTNDGWSTVTVTER